MNPANKAWYWLAAGVLALGLNGYYQDGGFQALHRLAGCTSTAIAQDTSQFRQIATLAEVTLAESARCERPKPANVIVSGQMILPQAQVGIPARTQVRLAQLQGRLEALQAAPVEARMARFQQVIAQREMRRAQVELQNGRIDVLTDQGELRVAVPFPRVEVTIPQVSLTDLSEPR
ncbi:MAG TPA: hypothetical protein VGR48_18565 [Terriglobales bacterium]|nr:hypothetical protein [Terriglobales bacterium]